MLFAALAGAALAALQLIMLPELQPPPGRLLLAALAYSSWSAIWLGVLAFGFVELLALPARRLAAGSGVDGRLATWLVFSFGMLVALVAWWNRAETSNLLINGRRDALGAVAILVGFASLALLIRPVRAPFLRRPWLPFLFGLLLPAAAWTALLVVNQRRTPVEPAPHILTTAPRRLLFVVWEGADLPWLLPAIDRGDMPFLAERWAEGAWGQLRTVRPFGRPVALATLATACSPAIHGVNAKRAYRLPWLSPQSFSLLLEGPWPTPHQLPWRIWQRAATPPPRRAPLWEILDRADLGVGVVGWSGNVEATWSVPPPLGSEALPFSALDAEMRRPLEPFFVARPRAARSTRAAFSVAAQLTATAALQHAAEPVDALVLSTELPARLRPLWSAPDAEPEVARAALRLLDEELRSLWLMMGGEQTLLVVSSPYGMAEPTPLRRLLNLLGGRRQWPVSAIDSPDGFVLFSGPGVAAGTRVRAGRLADVAATTLYLLELPVARDMAGRVLLDAVDQDWAATKPLRLVASYPAGVRSRPASQPPPGRGTGEASRPGSTR